MAGGVNSSYSELPAKLDAKLTDQCIELGLATYRALGCTGIARVDMLIDGKTKQAYLNEVNTLPGSLYHHNWRAAGVAGVDLVAELLRLAEERHKRQAEQTFAFDSDILKQGVRRQAMKPYDPKQLSPSGRCSLGQDRSVQDGGGAGRENFYALVMFPYPSGDLQRPPVQLWPADSVARFQAAHAGQEVLARRGFELIPGLPAENAAIKRNISPSQPGPTVISPPMTDQLKLDGPDVRLDREVITSQPDY